MTIATGLKAVNSEMPDQVRWALESRLGTARRAAAAIATEAAEIASAIAEADRTGSVEDTVHALGLLVSFAHSAGASGGAQSKIHEVTEIAGAVRVLSETGALQAPKTEAVR